MSKSNGLAQLGSQNQNAVRDLTGADLGQALDSRSSMRLELLGHISEILRGAPM